jgi:putative transposase
LSLNKSLRLVGMAKSSWHYLHHPRPATVDPVRHDQRPSDVWLSPAERDQIVAQLARDDLVLLSVGEAFAVVLDEGTYIASRSSWYRVAAAHKLSGDRRRTATHPPRTVPEQVAYQVGDLWSWDITKLPTAIRGMFYEFYVVLDVFSRYVVGWRVEERENDELAKDMFQTAFDRHRMRPTVVHSDGGPSMTSSTVKELLADLNIEISRNRPRVSNDNPYSEAWFKTAKYEPGYPLTFESLNDARQWAATFVGWYNTEHRHSGIAWHTPQTVFDGTWIDIQTTRQATLDTAWQATPQRFTTRPTSPQLPIAVWINNPARRFQTA